MKRFIIHIITLLAGMLFIMIVLDYTYTKVYELASPRSKFQMFRMKKGGEIDYAFLGSSRVDNDLVPEIVKKQTGREAMNLGFQASKLDDIYTILKLFKSYDIKTKKVFIQIDYAFNLDGNSNMMQYQLVPFIRDNAVTKAHFRDFPNYRALYYVPFYRYCVNDYKIGLRELCLCVLGKKTAIVSSNGYSPLVGSSVNDSYSLPEMLRKDNPRYDSIAHYCIKNHIDVVYFCAPFSNRCKNLDYISGLKHKIPKLHDYSAVVKNDSLFHNNSHLNDKGARFFTSVLTNDLLLNKPN